MSLHYELLNPLTAPLTGLRLIEASAGTGKTWVIAALYVRAVLGHGGQPARTPPEILVVTFTRDATAELRERIRSRLEEAARAFRAGESTDTFLHGLLTDYAEGAERNRAARQLEHAAQWMDEAAIFTIHSWANRMLGRHAFDSGRSLGEAGEADQYEHVGDACRDYWRREVYPLEHAYFTRVQEAFPGGPDDLAKAVASLLSKQLTAQVEGGAEPLDTLAATLGAAFGNRAELERQERAEWVGHVEALRHAQQELLGALNAGSRQARNLSAWTTQLAAWTTGERLELEVDDLRSLGAAGLASKLKKNCALPECSAYAAAERLASFIEQTPKARPITLRHALYRLPAVIQRAKEQRGEISFDDMLSELDRALAGERGDHLAQALRTQLPIALIDEFQDTDPLQWRIFERVYATDGALILIGDPKQSIYGFRGADIGTYFKARSAAQQPALTLPRNFRSTKAMVDAVNALFARADEVAADGAFGYGTGGEGLPFQVVESEGRSEQLNENGAIAPALTIVVPSGDKVLNKGAYQVLMAVAAAERAATWLADGVGARVVDVEQQTARPVRPSDIAILVRTGNEAGMVRAELRKRGLASVYLSDKQSVFASIEAADLLHWLAALAEPGSDRALRAALATSTTAFSFAEIEEVANDDLRRDELIEVFSAGARLWRERGVLAAVRHLIHALELPARHASTVDAERCLTNLLHIAELLQHAAVHLDGEHALIRHLAEAIATSNEPGGDSSGAMVQRLESEADLIRVITIHKSKGLQYKLVLIPFPCSFRIANPKKDTYFEFEREGSRIVSLEPSAEAVEAAQRASVREEVRLLYVAVTRAELGCWIGAAAVVDGQAKTNGAPFSGFGRLLSGGAELGAVGVRQAIEELVAREKAIALVALPEEVPVTRAAQATLLEAVADPRAPLAPRAPAWWLSSYSSLVRGPRRVGVDVASAAETVPLEEYAEHKAASVGEVREASIHGFPRGPSFGSFLHYLLEWTALVGFERAVADANRTNAEIARRAETAGLADWTPVLQAWLPEFLAAEMPLPNGQAVALQGLRAGRVRPEFAFMLEANNVRLAELDALVTQHMLPGHPRPPLTQKHINGMVSGFIDLVFEREGAWYTLDYKSNHLADRAEGYTESAMTEEMAHHRYDLQAALYLLALHRFLRTRLADYDPARHIGGVLYPFLRGVGKGTGVFVARPDVALLEALDTLFAGDLQNAA